MKGIKEKLMPTFQVYHLQFSWVAFIIAKMWHKVFTSSPWGEIIECCYLLQIKTTWNDRIGTIKVSNELMIIVK